MSCNGCRVLRKGCSESCILRPCLDWIKSAQCQANATAFLARFYGRTGLINLISNGPPHSRPALFRSLLYEACGRILNPIYGSVGLLWSGNWAACQAGVESILQGMYPVSKAVNTFDNPNEEHQNTVHAGTLMHGIASELHKVKARGKFKCVDPRRKAIKPRKAQFPNNIEVSSGVAEGRGGDIRKTFEDTLIIRGNDAFTHSEEKSSAEFMALELTLGASSPHKLAD